jgi:two-component system, chemotaxis family, sensor kinase CheA
VEVQARALTIVDELSMLVVLAEPSDATTVPLLQSSLADLAQLLDGLQGAAFQDAAARTLVAGALATLDGAQELDQAEIDAFAAVATELRAMLTSPAESTPEDEPAAGRLVLPDWLDEPTLREAVANQRLSIEELEAEILALERGDTSALTSIHHRIHTLKGEAGVLSFDAMERVCHELEDFLDLDRPLRVRVDHLLAVADWLGTALDAYQVLRLPTAVAIREALRGAMAEEAAAPSPAAPSPAAPSPAAPSPAAPSPAAPVAEAEPDATDATDVPEWPAAASLAVPPAPTTPSTGGKAPAPTPNATAPTAPDAVIKIGLRRVDSLVEMIGELVIVESMVTNSPELLALTSASVRQQLSLLGKITRDLQTMSMSMRMVPVRGVFQKVARSVRDLARRANKDVGAALVGENTEMDRSMVEQIADPLITYGAQRRRPRN